MNNRDQAGFFCTAEILLELILQDKNIDLKEHKEHLVYIVRDIYEDLPPADLQSIFQLMINLTFDDWTNRIIEFGKENGIPEEAWLEAIEKRA